jgi:hypothetical protein
MSKRVPQLDETVVNLVATAAQIGVHEIPFTECGERRG